MRRSLVLTDEAARHPFRRSLPPHVCGAGPLPRRRWPFTPGDLRQFLLAYCACFVAALAFLG